jgi:two-component system chemotaxis response regulator CheB
MYANRLPNIQPLRTRLIVIAAPAGGFLAVSRLIGALPASLNAAVIVLEHHAGTKFPIYERLLHRWSSLPVVDANEAVTIRPGHVYVVPTDRYLMIADDRTFTHGDATGISAAPGSANPLLESAARVYGPEAVTVILTGSDCDRPDGVQSFRNGRGLVIAEQSTTAHTATSRSASETGTVDLVLPKEEIAPMLIRLVGNNHALGPVPAT